MQLSNAHILKFVTAKLHTLSMNVSQTKHMQLLCKLSIDIFTTCIPRIQNKKTWQISQNKHNLKASLDSSLRSQFTNLAKHGNEQLNTSKLESQKKQNQEL